MNLEIQNQLFIVCGATSGFGEAVAETLAIEGASVIAIARTEEKLKELQQRYPAQIETICSDIMLPGAVNELYKVLNNRAVHGMLVNAGGPPAKTVLETTLEDWDNAYKTVLRWKVDITQSILPLMMKNSYGRIVYIESASVKQPMENLVLSNSLRLAVVGFIKSLSQEIAASGVTLNVLAPGYHETAAMERIFKKKSEQTGVTREEAMRQFIHQTGVGGLGSANDFASLAVWLLSPHSRYITGQTISVAGGIIKGVMG